MRTARGALRARSCQMNAQQTDDLRMVETAGGDPEHRRLRRHRINLSSDRRAQCYLPSRPRRGYPARRGLRRSHDTQGLAVDRFRRALDLFSAGAAGGAPLSINVRSIRQQTQKTIRTGLNRCEGLASASRARLLLLSGQLRNRLQLKRKPQTGPAPPRSAEDLYAALWDRMLRAIGRAAVNHTTDDWPGYFNGLRNLTRKLVAESAINGLSDDEQQTLLRRLLERIDQFERSWPGADTAPPGTSKDQEPGAAEPVRPRRKDDPWLTLAKDGPRALQPPRRIAPGRVEPSRNADDQLRTWLTPAPAQPAPSSQDGTGKDAV